MSWELFIVYTHCHIGIFSFTIVPEHLEYFADVFIHRNLLLFYLIIHLKVNRLAKGANSGNLVVLASDPVFSDQ